MAIFASVFLALDEGAVPFLVIGGHAVVLHGHLRNTFDLDLLIADSSLATARAILTELGYRTFFETDAFLQLQAPANFPPLDLMIVDEHTFNRIEGSAIGGCWMVAKFEFPMLSDLLLSNSTPPAIRLDETPRPTGRMWSA